MNSGVGNHGFIEVKVDTGRIGYFRTYLIIRYLIYFKLNKSMGGRFVDIAVGQHDIIKRKPQNIGPQDVKFIWMAGGPDPYA